MTTNSTFVRDLFPNADADVDRAYFWVNPPKSDCPDPSNPKCIGDWCQGLPGSVAACRSADGTTEHPLQVNGIDATAYAALLQSLAVAFEVVMFLGFGSIADFGGTKKKAFLAASALGGVTTLLFGGLTPDTWWIAGPIVIISNVMFGFTSMLLSAFLPGIVRGLPVVQRAARDAAAQYFPEMLKLPEGTVSISVQQYDEAKSPPLPPSDEELPTALGLNTPATPIDAQTANAIALEANSPVTLAVSSRIDSVPRDLEVDDSSSVAPAAAIAGFVGQQPPEDAPQARPLEHSNSNSQGSARSKNDCSEIHAEHDDAMPVCENRSGNVTAADIVPESVRDLTVEASPAPLVAAASGHETGETLTARPTQHNISEDDKSAPAALHISARAAALSSLFQMVEHEGNVLSNRGYGTGYAGGLTCLILVVPFTIFLDDTLLAYNLGIVVSGLWWLSGVAILAPRIRDRKGRERPPNKNIMQLSVQGLCETIRQIRQLPQSRNFLLCWFLLSDGVSVQVTVGALFANSFVEWGCIPKSIGLAVVIMMIPLFGIIGNFGTLWASRKYGWSPKSVVQGILLIACVVPIYGMVGMATTSFGIHQGFELFFIAPILGVASALTQAFSRSVFVTLIPAGYESSWSSLFELTNKSSSFVGPAVVAAFAQAGLVRISFVYILLMLVIPAIALFWVDERLGAREARNYSKQQLASKFGTPAITEGYELRDE